MRNGNEYWPTPGSSTNLDELETMVAVIRDFLSLEALSREGEIAATARGGAVDAVRRTRWEEQRSLANAKKRVEQMKSDHFPDDEKDQTS